ncbi:MAG TPA: hypothetical protein VIL48_03750 [Acidimicrobiales bacterium]
MVAVIAVLVVGVLVAAVLWNRRNAARAMAGERFELDHSVDEVSRALAEAYCSGGNAALNGFARRFTVAPVKASSFRVTSAIGDVGHIRVRPSPGGGTVVEASTDELYIGRQPMVRPRRPGPWALSNAVVHVTYRALGITPNAGRMKRFQRSVGRHLTHQLERHAPV